MEQLHPDVHILGRAADAELDFLSRLGGRLVLVHPFHRGKRQFLGVVLKHDELLRNLRQGVVKTRQLHDISPRFQCLAFVELGLVIHADCGLIDQSLILLVVETIHREQPRQFSVTQHLSVQLLRASHRIEIVDLGNIFIAVNLA